MQNDEVNEGKSVDYDQLSHNAAQNEMETDGYDNDLGNKKDKTRRYWTAKEEEKFFEIWGRENWRLTRHGKNTVFFAQWSRELKERFDMDIKPEEVQAKVNQTRAKFRSVKKSIETDFVPTKWKKYDIIDRILKNTYRSNSDDPVPKEALENNRDFSPNSRQAPTPNSITSNSNPDGLNMSGSGFGVTSLNNTSLMTNDEDMSGKMNTDMTNNLYGETQTNHNYNTEMYGDQYQRGDIKREYDEEYQNYNYGEQMHYGNAQEPHLHHLQAPQLSQQPQQQQPTQQSSQQTIYGPAPPLQPPSASMIHPAHHIPANMNPNVQDVSQMNSQEPSQPTYEPVSNPTYTNLSDQTSYANGTYNPNYNTTVPPVPPPMPQQVQNPAIPISPNAMQPPRQTACNTPGPRKRGRPIGPNIPGSTPTSAASSSAGTMSVTGNTAAGIDSLEAQYMEQVRKKNLLLEESRDISKRRLETEERKVKLMEDYFPKLFNLQHEILEKVNAISTNSLSLINSLNSHLSSSNFNNGNVSLGGLSSLSGLDLNPKLNFNKNMNSNLTDNITAAAKLIKTANETVTLKLDETNQQITNAINEPAKSMDPCATINPNPNAASPITNSNSNNNNNNEGFTMEINNGQAGQPDSVSSNESVEPMNTDDESTALSNDSSNTNNNNNSHSNNNNNDNNTDNTTNNNSNSNNNNNNNISNDIERHNNLDSNLHNNITTMDNEISNET